MSKHDWRRSHAIKAEGMGLREILEQAATSVRDFLEGATATTPFLRDFPQGGCGCASEMLATWLRECGIEDIWYVSGELGEMSHAWLEVGGIVVDITSDQFIGGLGRVYVGQRVAFQQSFQNQRREENPTMSGPVGQLYRDFIDALN